MSDQELTAIRAREALRILSVARAPVPRATVWADVVQLHPLTAAEEVPVNSGGANGEVDWNWQTATFVKAGWLHKGGAAGWSITEAGRQAYEAFVSPPDMVREARALYTQWDKARSSERANALASRIVPIDTGAEEVIKAAGIFTDRALVAGESVFSPGRAIWSELIVKELEQTFVASTTTPGQSFIEQLQVQLKSVSDDAKLLMAELVALQLLPASTDAIGARKKAERVESVLAMMGRPVQIPSEIDQAFGFGSFNPGTRMSSALGAAMTIVVNFAAAWTRLDSGRHEELLDDPWAFRDFVLAIPGESFPSQRWSLMYLLHPQSFVSIVSEDHKKKIREVFLGEISESSGDLDRDLRDITIALQVKNKGPVSYYRSPLREKWQAHAAAPVQEESAAGPDSEDSPARPRAAFAPATDELAASVHITREWLQDRLNLLERKKQMILYGPPGTGKTYVAKTLARHISLGAEPVIVQFHPSYSYEDFVQGFRPAVEDSALVYRLKDGPFLSMAREARSNPETSYVLVIDEINRGNIAKVFGELYFLLEYRDESISLLYGEERFQLPGNVFIIGTMNTTDRSIALLDAAMRRRFAFVELHPDKEPTSAVLRSWLDDRGLPHRPAALLDALNKKIVEPSARIGPSYLMPQDGDLSEVRLREIWRYELLPLLEEAHYGEERDLEAEFGIDALEDRDSDG